MTDDTLPVGAAELAAAVARAPELAPGTVLAERYRIVRLVARGGMGAVYEAEDAELGIAVALKTIRPDVAWGDAAVERFKREIQLARTVTHPGVCRIFDLGRHGRGDGSVVFLTMELLAGETLADRLRRGAMTTAEARPIVQEILDALGAAHAAGIVHRDLKPANVILAPRRAVVTDFGLAREVADAAEEPEAAGTPGYMAPEQRAGGAVGPATDLYALGVVIAEMLTGRSAAGEPPALDGIDPRWAAAIRRCLAADPAERFASTAELAAALAPPRRRRALAAGAAVVAAGAIVAAVLLAGRGGAVPPAGAPRGAAAAAWAEGQARLRDGDEAAAARAFREVIAAEPDFALAHAELAGALFAQGDHAGAREAAAAAAARSGALGREHALIVEARQDEATYRWDRAIERYQELRRIDPGEREYLLRLTYAQIFAGRYRDARTSLDELAAGAPHPRIDMLEAYLASKSSDWTTLLAATRRAAEAADRVGARRLAALAWDEQGVAHFNLGALDEATAALGEAEGRFRASGDRAGVARVQFHRAQVAAQRGELAAARALCAEALAGYREIGHRDGQAMTQVCIAMYAPPDRLDEARAGYEEALALYRAAGDRPGVAATLLNLASVHWKLGDHAGFRAAMDEVLGDAREIGDQWTIAAAATNLGLVTLWEADPPRAQVLLEEAAAAARDLADPTVAAYVHWGLGEIARARGDAVVARRELEAARADAARVSDPSPVEQARCSLARLDARGVTEACDAASRALEQLGATDDAVVLAWQVVRAHLSAGDRAAAAAAGERLAALAATSHDRHTALIARLAAAELRGGPGAPADLAAIAEEAEALGARELAFEARFAVGRAQRAIGRRKEAAATFTALAADAAARGMTALAKRATAAAGR